MKCLSVVLIVILLLNGCLSEQGHAHAHGHTHGDKHVHAEVESHTHEGEVKEHIKVHAHSHDEEHVQVKETVVEHVHGDGKKEIVKESVKVHAHSHDHGDHDHSHDHAEVVKETVKLEVRDDGEKEIVKETVTIEKLNDDGKKVVKESVKVHAHSHDHGDHGHSHEHAEKESVKVQTHSHSHNHGEKGKKENVQAQAHSHSHNDKGHSHGHSEKSKTSESKKIDFEKIIAELVEKINKFVDTEKIVSKFNEIVAKIDEVVDFEKIVGKINEIVEKIKSDEKVNEVIDNIRDFDVQALFVKYKLDKDPKMAALVSTAFVGIVPIFIILIIPLGKRKDGKPSAFLKSILAFAVGGLLGDTFLHLIPHSLEPLMTGHSHSHEGEHDHAELNEIGLLILSGMFAFFIIEKLATLNSGGGHSHGKKKNKKGQEEQEKIQRLRVSAILNMIGDTIHNFTDGMAIAASFMASYKLGISTTIAVFFHEIPHEIGDMAILAQSGYGKIQIMFIQVLTALGCVGGAYFSFFADELPFASTGWMLPFIAGGFIYIATVDVIPTLFEKTTLKQTISEMFFMVLGVTLMLFITH